MSVALLSVQFRNLLPSEEVLMYARTLWHDLQQSRPAFASGDATLSITRGPAEYAPFQAELTIEGSSASALGAGTSALEAVRDAFRQLGFPTGPRLLRPLPLPGNLASARSHRSLSDTDLG